MAVLLALAECPDVGWEALATILERVTKEVVEAARESLVIGTT